MEVITYISILNQLDLDIAKKIYNECITLVSDRLKISKSKIKSIITKNPQFKPVNAKLKRSDVYDTLVLCNNNTEVKTNKVVPQLSDPERSIYMDIPESKNKRVDIRAYFGTKEGEKILGKRKFKYIVMGECPYFIYTDISNIRTIDPNNYIPINYDQMNFIHSIYDHLEENGQWHLYTPGNEVPDKYGVQKMYFNDLQQYGFIFVGTKDVIPKFDFSPRGKLIIFDKI